MEIILNEDGTISFTEEVKKAKESIDLYVKIEVSDDIIEKCEKIALDQNKTLFIFDKRINDHFNIELEDKDIFFEDDVFFISNENGLLPQSRIVLYDSETKILDQYKRYDYIYNFITTQIDFIPSEWNLGREYEQIFKLDNISLTLHKNMLITIRNYTMKTYHGYFSKNELLKYIKNVNDFNDIDFNIENLLIELKDFGITIETICVGSLINIRLIFPNNENGFKYIVDYISSLIDYMGISNCSLSKLLISSRNSNEDDCKIEDNRFIKYPLSSNEFIDISKIKKINIEFIRNLD